MARGTDQLINLAIVGGVGYVGYRVALTGGLGAAAQKTAFDLAAAMKGRAKAYEEVAPYILPENVGKITPTGPGGILPGGDGGNGTDAEVAAWARGIGLSYEVGRRFKADHGRMPNSIAELEQWGASKNYRRADGSWVI